MTTFIRPATLVDVIDVAERLRRADRDEVRAVTGLPATLHLPEAFKSGRRMMVGGFKRAEVLFGCDPVLGHPHVGVIWMLGTEAIDRNPKTFLRVSKRLWDGYLAEFPFLTNFVMEANTVHVRWLEWLGARMIRRVERFGPHSQPFLEFIACASLPSARS